MRYGIGSIILVSGAICIQAGCSHLPGRESFGRLGLPSPSATIAAAENQEESPTKKRTSLFGGEKDNSRALAMEIARGQTYERGGNYDKARKVYEEVREREPNNVEAAHRLGIVADIQKRHGEAEQLFLFALSHEPNDAGLLSDLGYCLFLQGKLAPAADVLSRAVEIAPTHLRARNNLGLALGHMGQYEAALEQFTQAGNEADAYFNLAFVYAAQEKTDEAKNCFRRCLQIDSAHARAREALVSFDEYERLSPAMRDSMPELADGVHYVPYQEVASAGAEINDAVQQASAQTSIPSSRDAAKSAYSLHQRSRGMLNRNMSSNRPSALSGRHGETARLPAE